METHFMKRQGLILVSRSAPMSTRIALGGGGVYVKSELAINFEVYPDLYVLLQ